MKPITLVGAGFAGLTLAFELTELGLPVEIIEREPRSGGLLQTVETEFGLVESAANAVLSNADVEQLFAKLQIEFAVPRRERRKRFIYKGGSPRRWPLGYGTTLRLIAFYFRYKLSRAKVRPRPLETVGEWARRLVDHDFESRLLAPALQGIYAAEAKDLSASLVLGRLLNGEAPLPKGRQRGSSAPAKGMGHLVQRLEEELRHRGVIFHRSDFQLSATGVEGPIVLCTSAWDAAKILKEAEPSTSQLLQKCQSLPLLSVTLFFTPQPTDLKGFGCLFPVSEKFQALGVLFNTSIFAGRSAQRSETWILGGATHPQVLGLTDEQVLEAILADRRRLLGVRDRPLSQRITRWPRAIPHYSVAWESALVELGRRPPSQVYLHGNYLGALGLSLIHQRSKRLALELKERYG